MSRRRPQALSLSWPSGARRRRTSNAERRTAVDAVAEFWRGRASADVPSGSGDPDQGIRLLSWRDGSSPDASSGRAKASTGPEMPPVGAFPILDHTRRSPSRTVTAGCYGRRLIEIVPERIHAHPTSGCSLRESATMTTPRVPVGSANPPERTPLDVGGELEVAQRPGRPRGLRGGALSRRNRRCQAGTG